MFFSLTSIVADGWTDRLQPKELFFFCGKVLIKQLPVAQVLSQTLESPYFENLLLTAMGGGGGVAKRVVELGEMGRHCCRRAAKRLKPSFHHPAIDKRRFPCCSLLDSPLAIEMQCEGTYFIAGVIHTRS